MNNKEQQHNEKMKELQKHFKRLKRIAILIWLAANIVIDALAIAFLTIETIVFVIIIAFILSTMFMIRYLNSIDKIRVTQETLLMEEKSLGRLKF